MLTPFSSHAINGVRKTTEEILGMLNHKEMTAHIRNRIKVAGIKARVRMQDCCGSKVLQVNAPAYGVEFTNEQQQTIRHIAKCNGLTWVRGAEIDVERMTNPHDFNFYMGAV